jgi:signal transduction histidine kinase
VTGKVDLPREVETILQLLPDTRTVAVVVGSSPLEAFWISEMKKEFARFGDRLTFVWLNDLTFERMSEYVASLPPHSIVLYTLFAVDAAGVPFEAENALTSLHGISAAPIFGLYESELGKGVVGGPYSSQRRRGALTAVAARRILDDGAVGAPAITVVGLEPPVYDWRELKRWGIDEASLPVGSEVRFRVPTVWDQYRALIIAALSIFALQTALMVSLLRQRSHRRRAEEEAHTLSGRLIDKHEDERRWIARELHDDITQRLAGLSIDVAKLSGTQSVPDMDARRSLRAALDRLSEDVHDLSYRLHPSVLDDLGLVDALKAECDRVARSDAVRVDIEADELPQGLPRDVGLCIYRIAQEALRNVGRHAKASSAHLSLAMRGGGLRLAVSDNGMGFEPGTQPSRPSLGHASMRERLRLLGGELEIKSSPGRGTTVVAWVPIVGSPW